MFENRKSNLLVAATCFAFLFMVAGLSNAQPSKTKANNKNEVELNSADGTSKSSATKSTTKKLQSVLNSKQDDSAIYDSDVNDSADDGSAAYSIPLTSSQPSGRNANTKFDVVAISKFLDSIARAHIPHTFEDKKNWGKTSERWDGIKFRVEGLRVKTKRRKKNVNHGTWKKYKAELIDPDREFQLTVPSLEKMEGGKIKFVIEALAAVKLMARVSKWVKGVQLYSLSAEARSRVRLTTTGRIGFRLDFAKLPPDIVFEAKITDADIEVIELKLDRVSKASGEVSQQLGRSLRGTLDKQIEKKEENLVAKMNKSIKKKQDKFRFSLSDLLTSKWGKTAKELLPENITKHVADKPAK